jgi:HEAT repeat protein
MGTTLIALLLLLLSPGPSPSVTAIPALPALSAAQIAFEQATQDLQSPDAGTRLRTVQMLKDAAYPEAAVPLARLVGDPQDEIQLEAIAAELNIFLAERVVTKKRVGLLVEVRTAIAADAAFSAGASAIGTRPVPIEVLTALRSAARDDSARVALEALYAFGALAVEPRGTARHELLRASGPEIAALVGASDPAIRYAAARVMGRLFARRPLDDAIEPTVGDAVITALNDSDRAVKGAAMQALGAMRYDRAVKALTELFQYYGKGDTAEAALDALARIANPASVPLFTAQLAGRVSSLRGVAIEGLARVGDAAPLPDIQAAVAGDRTDGVRLAGLFAAALLDNGSIDRIAEAVTKSKLRDQARQYLAELAPGRSQAFERHLMDPDARIRLDVVEALGLGGDPAALAIVEPLTTDRDPQVARAAERAVARLRSAQGKPVS